MFYETEMVAIGYYLICKLLGRIHYRDIHKYRDGSEEVEVIE